MCVCVFECWIGPSHSRLHGLTSMTSKVERNSSDLLCWFAQQPPTTITYSTILSVYNSLCYYQPIFETEIDRFYTPSSSSCNRCSNNGDDDDDGGGSLWWWFVFMVQLFMVKLNSRFWLTLYIKLMFWSDKPTSDPPLFINNTI